MEEERGEDGRTWRQELWRKAEATRADIGHMKGRRARTGSVEWGRKLEDVRIARREFRKAWRRERGA